MLVSRTTADTNEQIVLTGKSKLAHLWFTAGHPNLVNSILIYKRLIKFCGGRN